VSQGSLTYPAGLQVIVTLGSMLMFRGVAHSIGQRRSLQAWAIPPPQSSETGIKYGDAALVPWV